MPRIALLSTSDTDLLSARASGADWIHANPTRGLPPAVAEADLVVARVLGTADDVRELVLPHVGERPLVVLGGELKTYEVEVLPDRLRALNVSLNDLFEAIEREQALRGTL